MKIIATIKFNDQIALVLSEHPKFNYKQYGDIIIGIDKTETFVNCYRYEDCGNWKAFAGHKFDIQLENGEVIHCDGKWWHGGHKKAEEILGMKLVNVTYQDIESLKQFYVFAGDCAVNDKLEQLISGYDGKIYEYQEYEASINKKQACDLV